MFASFKNIKCKQLLIYLFFHFISVTQQVVSMVTSLLSISWIVSNYYESTHAAKRVSLLTRMGQFCWHLLTIAARSVAMALFGSTHSYYLFIFIGIHWLLMLAYRVFMSVNLCKNVLVNMVAAFTYIFTFNPKMGTVLIDNSYSNYMFYYILVYAENGLIMYFWYKVAYLQTGLYPPWYSMIAMSVVFGGVIVGIACMILFYKCCNKNKYEYNKNAYAYAVYTLESSTDDTITYI